MITRLIVIFIWVAVVFLILQSRGNFWPRIDQDVDLEVDGNYRVNTMVWYNDKIVWSHYTFQDRGMNHGIQLNQIDSAKKSNYELAENIVAKLKNLK